MRITSVFKPIFLLHKKIRVREVLARIYNEIKLTSQSEIKPLAEFSTPAVIVRRFATGQRTNNIYNQHRNYGLKHTH